MAGSLAQLADQYDATAGHGGLDPGKDFICNFRFKFTTKAN